MIVERPKRSMLTVMAKVGTKKNNVVAWTVYRPSLVPRPLPDFISLRDKIWVGPGDEAKASPAAASSYSSVNQSDQRARLTT